MGTRGESCCEELYLAPWDLTCHSGKRPLTLAFSDLDHDRCPAQDSRAPSCEVPLGASFLCHSPFATPLPATKKN